MADYSKMTKQQLIEELNKLTHVGEAVHAKDLEINELKEKLDYKIALAVQEAKKELLLKDEKIEELQNILKTSESDLIKKIGTLETEKAKVIDDNRGKIAELEVKHQEETKEQVEHAVEIFRKENESLRKFADRRANELNKLMANHGSLLKTLQGVGDMAIALNEYMYDEFMRKEK